MLRGGVPGGQVEEALVPLSRWALGGLFAASRPMHLTHGNDSDGGARCPCYQRHVHRFYHNLHSSSCSSPPTIAATGREPRFVDAFLVRREYDACQSAGVALSGTTGPINEALISETDRTPEAPL